MYQQRKDIVSNKWFWEYQLSTCKRIKLAPLLSHLTNNQFQMVNHLNLRSKTLKLLGKIVGRMFPDIGKGQNFLNRISVTQEIMLTVDKWNFIKLINFYTASKTVNWVKRYPTEWNNFLLTLHLSKYQYPEYTNN